MMKNLIKKSRGVTLISLVVTVTVILIMTNIVVFNVADSVRTTKLSNMQADIENLRDKVSAYYTEYGMIPADTSIEYTNTNHITSISRATDIGPFYVIDLEAMENITLNYGKDYEKIRNGEAKTQEEINQLRDLYIINSTSHNVFYVDGIKTDSATYYTDYSAKDADKVPVSMHNTVMNNKIIAMVTSINLESDNSIRESIYHVLSNGEVDISKCKWVYNTKNGEIGTNEDNYPNTFSEQGEEIVLKPSGTGIHYLHILTVDKEGNKTETIIRPIVVEIKATDNKDPVSGVVASIKTEKGEEISNAITGNNGISYLIFNEIENEKKYYCITDNIGDFADHDMVFETQIDLLGNNVIQDENAINNGYSFSESIDEYGFIHLTPYSKTVATPTL